MFYGSNIASRVANFWIEKIIGNKTDLRPAIKDKRCQGYKVTFAKNEKHSTITLNYVHLFMSCHQLQSKIFQLSPKIPFFSPLGNMPRYMRSRIPKAQTAERTKVKLYSILSLGPPLSWIWNELLLFIFHSRHVFIKQWQLYPLIKVNSIFYFATLQKIQPRQPMTSFSTRLPQRRVLNMMRRTSPQVKRRDLQVRTLTWRDKSKRRY